MMINSIKTQILDVCEPLTREQEIVASDHDLVKHNLRFMVKSFKKYLDFMPYSEYVSEIINAMYVAASRYDRKSGNRFNTYARPWVSVYLWDVKRKNYNGNYYTGISINSSAWKKLIRFNTFKKNFIAENGHNPSLADYRKEFKMANDESVIHNVALAEGGYTKSTDETVSFNNSTDEHKTFGDSLSGESVFGETSNVYGDIEYNDIISTIKHLIYKEEVLPTKLKTIYKCIYELGLTAKETASKLKLKRAEVEKLHEQLVKRLQEVLNAKKK